MRVNCKKCGSANDSSTLHCWNCYGDISGALNSLVECPEIRSLERALKFYDDVVSCRDEDERMTVGTDHQTWLLRAAREAVKAHNDQNQGRVPQGENDEN